MSKRCSFRDGRQILSGWLVGDGCVGPDSEKVKFCAPVISRPEEHYSFLD